MTVKGHVRPVEQVDDALLAQALFDTAEGWCRHRGLTYRAHGLSALDGFGADQGFESRRLGMHKRPLTSR